VLYSEAWVLILVLWWQAICTVDLITRFNIVPTLYTFGEPRAGDHDFSSTITQHENSFR
jgi:hypothetical protein